MDDQIEISEERLMEIITNLYQNDILSINKIRLIIDRQWNTAYRRLMEGRFDDTDLQKLLNYLVKNNLIPEIPYEDD